MISRRSRLYGEALDGNVCEAIKWIECWLDMAPFRLMLLCWLERIEALIEAAKLIRVAKFNARGLLNGSIVHCRTRKDDYQINN